MTVETPPLGKPGPAAAGFGRGADTVEARALTGTAADGADRGELVGGALRGLAAELRSRGVEVREDRMSGVVDAGPSSRPQRALLRPHRGGLWWWMRWPLQDGLPAPLAGVPLSPVTRTGDAARRIAGALSSCDGASDAA
ncbi:hypothetical protein ACFXKD_05355 [Nocardiopsis aegyptia]|uniref:hypothetical protein n=1 Tax=Nocardiopsis aegyptia TaxID=220378 RepID=UPI00366FB2DB